MGQFHRAGARFRAFDILTASWSCVILLANSVITIGNPLPAVISLRTADGQSRINAAIKGNSSERIYEPLKLRREELVRPYRPGDLPIIMDIANRAWRGIYRMFREIYGDELFELLVPDERTSKGEQVRAHCERHPEWVFVCEEEGRIVGFVTFRLDFDRKIGEIGNNARDPDCDLKGIGQQMYKAVFDYFRKHGMLYAKVFTGLDYAHAPARRAYERAGFNIRHECVEYFMKL